MRSPSAEARLAGPLGLLSRGGAILCYHGLDRVGGGAGAMHVTPAELAMAAEVARALGEVVPTSELVRRHRAGRSTRRLFAFTFDDAYLSLLRHGAPLFREAALPVTVFALPPALDTGATFWWDRVDALVPRLPAAERSALFRRLGIPEVFQRRHQAGFGPQRPLRQWVIARYAARWPARYDEILAPLEQRWGTAPADRSMTWAELQRLTALPGVEVGVHTLSHPALPLLPREEQQREISGAHRRLAERLPATLPLLAAPFGLFDAQTLAAAAAAGMEATLTLTARTLAHPGPADALPRFCLLGGERPLRLALRLSGAADRARALRGAAAPAYPVPPRLEPGDQEAGETAAAPPPPAAPARVR